jgi:hypothetical protein
MPMRKKATMKGRRKPYVAYREGRACIKSPYMAAELILITETAEITVCAFLEKGDIQTAVLCGAAQNMDLFLHTRPLFLKFMQL